MHEGDGSRQAVPRFAVNQRQPVGSEDFQLAADVVHVQGQMVQALAAPLDETADRALRRRWLEQLQAGLPDLDKAGPHALVVQLNHLGIRGAEVGGEEVKGGADVVYRNAHVVDVVDGANFGHLGFHPHPNPLP